MERQKLVFWRSFISLTLLSALLISGLMLGSLYSLKSMWMPVVELMHLPEIVITAAACLLFIAVLLLCPLLALHIMIRRHSGRSLTM